MIKKTDSFCASIYRQETGSITYHFINQNSKSYHLLLFSKWIKFNTNSLMQEGSNFILLKLEQVSSCLLLLCRITNYLIKLFIFYTSKTIFLVFSAGPSVVFLHGFPEIWYSWRHQMIALANAGFRAIAVDLRGYGLSEKHPQLESASFNDFVEDTLALLEACHIEKVTSSSSSSFLFTFFSINWNHVGLNLHVVCSYAEKCKRIVEFKVFMINCICSDL